MTEKEAIQESIEHWKRMIEWTEKQQRNKPSYSGIMNERINEDWFGEYCSLCVKNYVEDYDDCPGCPLEKKFGKCGHSNKTNMWGAVFYSSTWEEWLKYAKLFLEQLRSLL